MLLFKSIDPRLVNPWGGRKFQHPNTALGGGVKKDVGSYDKSHARTFNFMDQIVRSESYAYLIFLA